MSAHRYSLQEAADETSEVIANGMVDDWTLTYIMVTEEDGNSTMLEKKDISKATDWKVTIKK